MSLPLALKSASCHVRNLRTRLPFRYGAVTLTQFPLLHLAVEVEAADGRRGRGFAADNLPPKWFDKDPSKSFRDNVTDQLAEGGRLRVGSLATPGYGVAFEPDLEAMIPLERWTFASLTAS